MKLIFIITILLLIIVLAYIASLYMYLVIKLVADNLPKKTVFLITLVWILIPIGIVFMIIKVLIYGKGTEEIKVNDFVFRIIFPIFTIFYTTYIVFFKSSDTVNKMYEISNTTLRELNEEKESKEIEEKKAIASYSKINKSKFENSPSYSLIDSSVSKAMEFIVMIVNTKSKTFLRSH